MIEIAIELQMVVRLWCCCDSEIGSTAFLCERYRHPPLLEAKSELQATFIGLLIMTGKQPRDIASYMSVNRTSCVPKTMERMIHT